VILERLLDGGDRLMGRHSGLVAWVLALAAGLLALAALGYGSRDADSRLYAEIAAASG